jgi:copper(I)-binding protein
VSTVPAAAPVPPAGGPGLLRGLGLAAAGPLACAIVLTGLLSGWVGAGGAGTLTRVRLQVTLAAVPMRGFTPQASAAAGAATSYLTIRNLTATPDELIAVSSPISRHVVLTQRAGPTAARIRVAALTIPAHGTLMLSPIGSDVVLQDPVPFETLATVPLTLTFRNSGSITIDAPVTPPGTP